MGLKGAIIGDIAGSKYEMNPCQSENYELFDEQCRFTDDTVLSIATMEAMHNKGKFEDYYIQYGKKYPDAGYGSAFRAWIFADEQLYDEEIWEKLHPNEAKSYERKPYNSYGNGSAMRCSYIGEYYRHNPFFYFVKRAATNSAKVTHNHPEGIKGAVTIAMCVWMAERNKSKEDILKYAIKQYPKDKYDFGCELPFDAYKDGNILSSSCMVTVPIAIRLFYENDDFEEMCKKINCIQSDTDTICAMAGSIFHSYYSHCTLNDEDIIRNYLDDFLISKLKKYGGIFYDTI